MNRKATDKKKEDEGMLDADMDGMIDGPTEAEQATAYAENLATQLRKGYLAYCVLLATQTPRYTSDILRLLADAHMVAVEGTMYPLLSRLQREGLLQHEWQESEQGPPRKYYSVTEYGQLVAKELEEQIMALEKTLKQLKKGEK